MKKILTGIVCLMAVLACYAATPEQLAGGEQPKAWYEALTVAPIGAVKTLDITGQSQWGAGLRVGYSVNPYVSIVVDNLSFEGPGETSHGTKTKGGFESVTTGPDKWGGSLVDESDFLVKAKIASLSTEKFSLYGIGGGLRDWDLQSWGFQAGLGAELSVSKHVSLFSDYSLQALFKDENGSSKRSLLKFGVGISF